MTAMRSESGSEPVRHTRKQHRPSRCSTKSVQRLLVRTGGYPPRRRVRSPVRLTVGEREEISRGLKAGESLRAIARRLNRAPSTISREVLANGPAGRYRAWRAERGAMRMARRPKRAKPACNPRLRAKVEQWLAQSWSPEQIAHRLKLEHPDDPEMHVCHETIYRSLFVQARGALHKELTAYLRTGRRRRHSRGRPEGAGRLRGRLAHQPGPRRALVRPRRQPDLWRRDSRPAPQRPEPFLYWENSMWQPLVYETRPRTDGREHSGDWRRDVGMGQAERRSRADEADGDARQRPRQTSSPIRTRNA